MKKKSEETYSMCHPTWGTIKVGQQKKLNTLT